MRLENRSVASPPGPWQVMHFFPITFGHTSCAKNWRTETHSVLGGVVGSGVVSGALFAGGSVAQLSAHNEAKTAGIQVRRVSRRRGDTDGSGFMALRDEAGSKPTSACI
jgi:hypothetical protein